MLRTLIRAGCGFGVVVGLCAVALADDFSIALEPGVAIPLSAPQNDLYNTGGGQAVRVLFGLAPYLDIGPAVTFLMIPSETTDREPGVAWGFGGSARLKRPTDATSFMGMSPWVDVDALFIRTGDLSRPGFDLGAGLAIPIDAERRFWAGPFVRYAQTITFARDGYDSSDAKTLLIGISLEVGNGLPRKHETPIVVEPVPVAVAVEPVPVAVAVAEPVISCPDRDQDGIPDSIDHCPDVAGPMENGGCPNYQKIIVKKDKLELKEKLYFAWDQAKLESASFPILDEVVQALKDNPSFRVQIEGHTDSSGSGDHNQTLSEQRALAVLVYLTAHGIAKDRLASKGFASSVPLDTNDTAAGRENNRRVEFVVNFVIPKTDGAK